VSAHLVGADAFEIKPYKRGDRKVFWLPSWQLSTTDDVVAMLPEWARERAANGKTLRRAAQGRL
jgi:hypothetical protein